MLDGDRDGGRDVREQALIALGEAAQGEKRPAPVADQYQPQDRFAPQDGHDDLGAQLQGGGGAVGPPALLQARRALGDAGAPDQVGRAGPEPLGQGGLHSRREVTEGLGSRLGPGRGRVQKPQRAELAVSGHGDFLDGDIENRLQLQRPADDAVDGMQRPQLTVLARDPLLHGVERPQQERG